MASVGKADEDDRARGNHRDVEALAWHHAAAEPMVVRPLVAFVGSNPVNWSRGVRRCVAPSSWTVEAISVNAYLAALRMPIADGLLFMMARLSPLHRDRPVPGTRHPAISDTAQRGPDASRTSLPTLLAPTRTTS